MSTYLIKDVELVNGEKVDIGIADGVIAEISKKATKSYENILDGSGCVALPGLVDLHTHLREPGREDAETVLTGTRAAARGGYTAVFAMANTDPVADTAGAVEQVVRLGKEAGWCEVFAVGAVTKDLAGESMAELGGQVAVSFSGV